MKSKKVNKKYLRVDSSFSPDIKYFCKTSNGFYWSNDKEFFGTTNEGDQFLKAENKNFRNVTDLNKFKKNKNFSEFKTLDINIIGQVITFYIYSKKKLGNDSEIVNCLKNNLEVKKALLIWKEIFEIEQICDALMKALALKDNYTAGHTKRVSSFCRSICEELNLSFYETELIRLSGLVHDIGKIGIPDHILKKPAPLDDHEFNEMKKHPQLSNHLVEKVFYNSTIIDGVKNHHEKFDGSGYPKGIKGEEIPLVARVIAVADTFDALISHRPYRKAVSIKKAYEIIDSLSGGQLDPVVVKAFQRWIKGSKMLRVSKKVA